jgi:hypothetical protein
MKWEAAGLKSLLEEMALTGATPGDLNYLMTCLTHAYIKRKGLNYASLNDVKGVFAAASDEFTRRVVNPYEDKKIEENGDV